MIEVIHGDCLEVMKTMADNSIDVIVTDPPYGLDILYGDGSYTDTRESLKNIVDCFIPQALRISKNVVLFPGINNLWLYPQADWVGCWYYGTTGNFGKYGFNAWQPILLYGKNRRRYGMDTIKYSRMEKGYDGHPCSKPFGLMVEVIYRFTEKEDTVLDPFAGSGTTLLACKKLGRDCIGIEREEKYISIIQERIKSGVQPNLV